MKKVKEFFGSRTKFYFSVIKDSIASLIENNSMTHASSIAFYTIFSLPAVLIITIVIGATFYEQTTVQQELMGQIAALIGRDNAEQVEKILDNASIDASGIAARTIGIATLIFSATTVFASLQTGLNNVWKIKAKPERGFVKFLVNRVLSMAMVVSIGFILLVSLLIDTVLVLFQQHMSSFFDNFTVDILTVANTLLSIAFITALFALIFKVLPDAEVKWKDVWIGSLITTGLFIIGKFLIGFYIGTSSITSTYGAAGSLVVVLIWVYYSTVILLLGAQITFVYADKTGERIKPYKNAVRIKTVEVEPKKKVDEEKDEAA